MEEKIHLLMKQHNQNTKEYVRHALLVDVVTPYEIAMLALTYMSVEERTDFLTTEISHLQSLKEHSLNGNTH